MLQGTINTFNSIKKTEIEAIKDNEATINQLKIDKLKAEFENEVSKLNNNIVSLEKDIELKESELKSLNNVISSKDLEIKTLFKSKVVEVIIDGEFQSLYYFSAYEYMNNKNSWKS